MKKRVLKRRRDGIKQHYHIGKNYNFKPRKQKTNYQKIETIASRMKAAKSVSDLAQRYAKIGRELRERQKERIKGLGYLSGELPQKKSNRILELQALKEELDTDTRITEAIPDKQSFIVEDRMAVQKAPVNEIIEALKKKSPVKKTRKSNKKIEETKKRIESNKNKIEELMKEKEKIIQERKRISKERKKEKQRLDKEREAAFNRLKEQEVLLKSIIGLRATKPRTQKELEEKAIKEKEIKDKLRESARIKRIPYERLKFKSPILQNAQKNLLTRDVVLRKMRETEPKKAKTIRSYNSKPKNENAIRY